MNKLFIFLLLLAVNILHAQSPDDDAPVNLDSMFPPDPYLLQLAADTCYGPQVDAISVIQYQGYSKVYVELKGGTTASQSLTYRKEGATTAFLSATTQNNKVLLNGLQPDALYTVRAVNHCGQLANAFVINTKKEPEEMVTVTGRFYDAIAQWLRKNDGTTFTSFLNNLTTVSPYQKIAFMQQFFFKGRVFLTDGGATLPTTPDGGGHDTCFCNSIRTTELAFPADQHFDTGTITDLSEPGSDYNHREHLGGDNNTLKWYYRNNRGAAKWHQLWTEGYKAKKGVDYDKTMSYADNSASSYQQSKLRINFLCLDGDKLPKACECEKTVHFWYRYDTKVDAIANIFPGGSASVNSIAEVEDFAVVSFLEEKVGGTFETLGFARARASSHCDRTPNPAFWTNTTTLLGTGVNLAINIFAATQGLDTAYSQSELTAITNGVTQFFSNLSTLINTPYYNPTNCNNDSTHTATVDGFTIKSLKPNTPVVLAINSFDKMYAGGRRSWQSYVNIHSDFHITAFIEHNAFDGTPLHCCTPRVGVWIVGSCAGPWTTEQLKIEVASRLYTAGISNLAPTNQGNGLTAPWEFGYLWDRASLEDCNKVIVNPGGSGNGGHFGDAGTSRSISEADLKDFSSLSIWDVSGRMIAQFKVGDLENIGSPQQLVESRLKNIVSGIYFVRLVSNGKINTQKIVIE